MRRYSRAIDWTFGRWLIETGENSDEEAPGGNPGHAYAGLTARRGAIPVTHGVTNDRQIGNAGRHAPPALAGDVRHGRDLVHDLRLFRRSRERAGAARGRQGPQTEQPPADPTREALRRPADYSVGCFSFETSTGAPARSRRISTSS